MSMLVVKQLSLVQVSSLLNAIARQAAFTFLLFERAGSCGRVGAIRLLLAHGADVHARNDQALR
jgi:hypothetical protein